MLDGTASPLAEEEEEVWVRAGRLGAVCNKQIGKQPHSDTSGSSAHLLTFLGCSHLPPSLGVALYGPGR